jgi:O-antigen/teichoic acid export membrane protein
MTVEGQESLKTKTLKGTMWSALDNVSRLGISFIVSLVLARLLGPEEYGLIGILTIFINIINALVDSGFTNALIRKQDATEDDYSTIFIVNICVSILLGALLFFSADLLAVFFERPQLTPLTRVMSTIVVINAFAIIQKVKLTKNIDFRTQTKVSVISSVISGFVGVGLAFFSFGVWALVFQQLTLQFLNTFFLWFYNRWFPRLTFSLQSLKELWDYSWKLLASGLIDTIWKEVYQMVIGKFYSPALLGYYTRAQQFSMLCSYNMTQVVQRVSFPVLSSIQDDRCRLRDAYRRIIRMTTFLTFLLMLGMAAVSKSMILSLIGEKWIECVPMLQILCFNMMLYPLHAINLNMLQVQGRSDLFLKLEIIKKTVSVIPIFLGIFVDIYIMLWGSVVVGLISYYLNAYYSGPFLNYSIKEQIKDIMPSLFFAASIALPVYLINYIEINCYLMLFVQIVLGLTLTIGICEQRNMTEYLEIKKMIYPVFQKLIKSK